MRPNPILALLLLAAMTTAAVADKLDALIMDLRYRLPQVLQDAALSLGYIGDPRAVDPLIETLKDDDWSVQQEAAWSLVKIGEPSVDPLNLLSYPPSEQTFHSPTLHRPLSFWLSYMCLCSFNQMSD